MPVIEAEKKDPAPRGTFGTGYAPKTTGGKLVRGENGDTTVSCCHSLPFDQDNRCPYPGCGRLFRASI